jgi:hypothetical protein
MHKPDRNNSRYTSNDLGIPINSQLSLDKINSWKVELPDQNNEIKPFGLAIGNHEIMGSTCVEITLFISAALCAGTGYVVANWDKISERIAQLGW